MSGELRFEVLGPLRVWRGTEQLGLGAPQQQSLLVMLLLAEGQPVPKHAIVEALWPHGAPRGAVAVIRTYASRLRRILELPSDEARGSIITSSVAGYSLHHVHDAAHVDLVAFQGDVRTARAARQRGALVEASQLLHSATARWEGPLLAGLPSLEAERTRLSEAYGDAVEARFEIDLELGRHADLVIALRAAVAERPYHEHFRELLMTALYRCGRQADALAVFREARQLLDEELGIEPGPGLARLHRQVLEADEHLLRHSGTNRPTAVVGPPPAPTPAQLPPPPTTFAGRAVETGRIEDAILATPYARTVVLEALGGRGKTALALHVAHRVADRFPDGQLYVELGAKSGYPADPDTVLTSFLEMLHVPRADQPVRLDQKAAVWRSVLRDKRVLLVLDDTTGPEQVRHLLPPVSGSSAIVTTTRRWLTNIDLERLTLDDLPIDDAVGVLAGIAGRGRVASDAQATRRLVELCGGNPLALRVFGFRLLSRPSWTLDQLVRVLDADRLGSRPSNPDWQLVEAPIRRALDAMSPELVEAFRQCSLVAEGQLTASTAATVLGRAPAEVVGLLERLSDEHLLDVVDGHRYRYSPLAATLARRQVRAGDGTGGDELEPGGTLHGPSPGGRLPSPSSTRESALTPGRRSS